MKKYYFVTEYPLKGIHVTEKWMIDNGFNPKLKSKTIYPLKYGKVPVAFARLVIDDEFKRMKVIVYDSNLFTNLYAPFYDREFGGENEVVKIIEKNIVKELKNLNVIRNRKRGKRT